jgi:outer membrane protein assembly factor BamB
MEGRCVMRHRDPARLAFGAIAVLGLLGSGARLVASEFDWPQWLGTARDGKSRESGLLKSWPKEGPPLAWKATGIGEGFSTPSIADGRIFTMSNREKTEYVLCLDEKDGKEKWASATGPSGGGGGYPGPRSTPTVDGELLYALGCRGILVCLKAADGQEVWRKDFRKEFGGEVGGWDYSESPLVDGEKLVVTPGGKKASIAALNKKTGDTLWSCPIPDAGNAEYSSVIAADVEGTRQYIQFLKKGVVGVAAADGKFLWRYDKPANGTANCSTPLFADGHVFAASSYGNGGGLAKVTKEGDGFKAEEVYFTKKMRNHHGGMVLVDGFLYGSDEGSLVCLDFKTGQVKWAERAPGKGSILFADGRLYYRNEGKKGTLFLVDANPEKYVEEGRFDQPDRSGREAWPHPVIANGKLYLRDQDLLLCYDVKAR